MVRLPISLLWSRVTPLVAPAKVPNSGWPSNPGALITTVGDEFPDEVGENEEDDLERATVCMYSARAQDGPQDMERN